MTAKALLGATLIGLVLPLVATAWVPVDCLDRLTEVETLQGIHGREAAVKQWARFEAGVRNAKPGSELYTPHPFPVSEKQILENFDYALRVVVVGDTPPEELLPELRETTELLASGALETDIVRVENWALSRCNLRSPKRFSHLVRLYDSPRTREIGRFVIHDSGLWGRFRPLPPGADSHWSQRIVALSAVADLLAEHFGFHQQVRDPQYVALDGLRYCSLVSPCIAFRSRGKIFLLEPGPTLYELGAPTEQVSVKEVRGRQARQEALAPQVDEEEPLVTTGFAWIPARRVAGGVPHQTSP